MNSEPPRRQSASRYPLPLAVRQRLWRELWDDMFTRIAERREAMSRKTRDRKEG